MMLLLLLNELKDVQLNTQILQGSAAVDLTLRHRRSRFNSDNF